MSKTVAIICEYNPFHNGHKYQIDKIREAFPNSTVIAIMSGNVTQRGEFSIFDKYSRAKCAVLCGINAVFELPYPYSCSSAEVFASVGVEIASKLGADVLCFGSESNDIDYLNEIAEEIDSERFEKEINELLSDKHTSYSTAREVALKSLGKKVPREPNDMLAIEYLRAIRKIAPNMTPYPIKREGEGYKSMASGSFMSASAIRSYFYEKNSLLSVPASVNQSLSNENYLDIIKAEEFLFRNALKTIPEEIESVYDTPKGCGYFISEIAKNSNNAREFFESLSSKTYTHSRLRRIIMYLATNTKNIEKSIDFTSLLAIDEKGREYLKKIRKTAQITIITKHSDAKSLNDVQKKAYLVSKRIDELYFSLLKSPVKPCEAYKKTTIVI